LFATFCVKKKERLEAAAARDAILSGYRDAIAGNSLVFQGDLRALLKKARK
jgi:hypothetical protein